MSEKKIHRGRSYMNYRIYMGMILLFGINKEEREAKESSNNNPLNNILTMAKNIDADKLQDGLSSIQKAVDLFGGLLVKDKENSTKSDYLPRPVYKRFDD